MIYGKDAAVSIHTAKGATVAEFLPASLSALSWGRKRRDISQLDLTSNDVADLAPFLDTVVPWHHWVTVWERDDLVWTGPIQVCELGRTSFTLSARDVSAFASRTRTPAARRWAGQTTSEIGRDLFQSMLDLQGLDHVRVNTYPSKDLVGFDFQITPDSQMLNSVLDSLVKMGLEWTVVNGTVVIGPVRKGMVTTLDEADLLTEIKFRRDGSRMYTDVRVQGQNFAHTAAVEGPRLQTIVNLDDLFGVANIRNAATEYVAQSGRVLETVIIPGGASLAQDADIDLDHLIPGARFGVFAAGRSAAVELSEMRAELGPNGYDLQVTLDSPALTPLDLERVSK